MRTMYSLLPLLLIIHCEVSTPAFANKVGDAQRFVKSVRVLAKKGETIEGIVYGNSQYGYFETKETILKDGVVTAKLVPPGYKFPIELYLRVTKPTRPSHLRRVSPVRFKYPLAPSEFQPQTLARAANLTPVFFLGTRGASKSTLAYILNRYGELVWAYTMSDPTSIVDVGKPLGKGRYALLGRNGIFEVVHFDGTRETVASFPGLAFDHDFIYDGDSKLIVISPQLVNFPGMAGSLLAPGNYRVGNILQVDLVTRGVTRLWNTLADGPVLYGSGWVDTLPKPDPDGSREFDHMNSLTHVRGQGYLLSNHQFHTLILLDETFKLRWSLGSSPGVTISTKGKPLEFRDQHHATILENGNLLLFDNTGKGTSRILELKVDEHKRSVELIKEFLPESPLLCAARGGAYRLANGNTLGAFNRPGLDTHIIEFDSSGRQVGILPAPKAILGAAYRMVPLDTIGRENYLGPSL